MLNTVAPPPKNNWIIPKLSLDEERRRSQNTGSNTAPEESLQAESTTLNENDWQKPFTTQGLQASLDLESTDLGLSVSEKSKNKTPLIKAEQVPDEMMLETVRKRQENKAITTQDVLNDFRKTATLLGADATFEKRIHTHFTLVNEEAEQSKPDEKWIKTLLSKLAQQLDATVSNTLGEKSSVVGEWLEALFTQPIEWKVIPLDTPSTLHQTLEKKSTSLVKEHPRVKHLLMKDALARMKQALQSQDWSKAEGILREVLSSIPLEEMPKEQEIQWKTLEFKMLEKQGRSEAILDEFVRLDEALQSPEIKRLAAYAYAKTEDFKNAVKTLYPLLTLEAQNTFDPKTRLKAWQSLSEWAKPLNHPPLEYKLLNGFFKEVQRQALPLEVDQAPLKRLQMLAQLEGDTPHAIEVVQARVSLSKKQKNKSAYESAIQDLASLFLTQGDTVNAEKVLGLLK